jgi:hypothetical protein
MFLTARDKPTLEQILARSKESHQTPWGELDGNGVNVTRIREQLKLSPLERVRVMEQRMRQIQAAKAMKHRVH